MTNPKSPPPCLVCGKTETLFCKTCKDVTYCSKACQKPDWRIHKLLCKELAKFPDSDRPTKEHFLAILFPVDEEKPKFIWLRCQKQKRVSVPYCDSFVQLPDTKELLGTPIATIHPIQYNEVLQRELTNTVHIGHRQELLTDGSKINSSIAVIASKHGAECHDLCGPILAWSNVGSYYDPDTCKDISLTEFRHVVDYLLSI